MSIVRATANPNGTSSNDAKVELTIAAVGLNDRSGNGSTDVANRPFAVEADPGRGGGDRRYHVVRAVKPCLGKIKSVGAAEQKPALRSEVRRRGKIGNDPQLRGRVEVEFLDHQFPHAGGQRPGNLVERVASDVVAHRRN